VRKIAKEHDVDISQIRGSGIAGRVTKDDILAYVEQGGKAERREGGKVEERRTKARRAKAQESKAGSKARRSNGSKAKPAACRARRVPAPPTWAPGESDHVERMSPMRKPHRRAHGRQPPHVRARALGVRGELLAHRQDPRDEESRLSSAPGSR
jgi:pyruvate/2-oxoglutarate dehydrogenase complex dihydrolipoamide acyltransferase (E2) component